MTENEKPLSTLVAQGWEIVSYSSGYDQHTGYAHNVLLRRQKQHRILIVQKKWWGKGLTVKELDL